jgi:hypothetical protein
VQRWLSGQCGELTPRLPSTFVAKRDHKWFESTAANYPVSQGDAGCFIHRLVKWQEAT